jgi:hypothetical protein
VNPGCVEGVVCGAAACNDLGGGAALDCWITCFDGDARLALDAITAFVCLGERCSSTCDGFM